MGRIHRYGQKRDRVAIVNLVAGKTREGRVIKTLLDKLEEIRKQLGSDKVFDVVGRISRIVPPGWAALSAVADDLVTRVDAYAALPAAPGPSSSPRPSGPQPGTGKGLRSDSCSTPSIATRTAQGERLCSAQGECQIVDRRRRPVGGSAHRPRPTRPRRSIGASPAHTKAYRRHGDLKPSTQNVARTPAPSTVSVNSNSA